MSNQQYLLKKGNTWYVVVEIPKSVRHLVTEGNGRRFIASLKTDSLARANSLKHAHVHAFKRRIELLKQGRSNSLTREVQRALTYRAAFTATDNEFLTTADVDGVGDHESTGAEELAGVIAEEAKALHDALGADAARLFHNVALGRSALISDHYEAWLSHRTVTEQTRDQQRSTVRLFLAWAGEHMTVEATDRLKAGQYVKHLQEASGFKRQTVARHLSALSMFWRWLISRGIVKLAPRDNPWREHDIGRRSKAAYRRRLTEEELLTLLNSDIGRTRYRAVLYDLIRLGMLTGARIGALCAIKSTSIKRAEDGYWLHVEKDKTEAGKRRIPFHSAGDGIIARRLADGDEYLFKGLKPGGRDGKRSHYVSRQYGEFRRCVGVDGRGEDFHAFRNTFLEHMEGMDVALTTAKLIVGHERGDITYGRYSSGELVKLRAAINKLDYGPAVMEAIRRPPREA